MKSRDLYSITIIVLTTDETDSLIKTVEGLMKLCNEQDVDRFLIVYPKSVSLETKKVISKIENQHPAKVIGYEQVHPNIGGAIKDGMELVTSSHTIVMVSDLAIELEAIPKIIAESKKNPFAIVKTSRWLKGGGFFGTYSPVRRVLNKIAQRFLQILFHTKLTDLTSPCQVMPTKICRSWIMKENGFPILLEMVIVPLKLGDKIIELPSKAYGREEGESKNSFFKTAAYFFTALRIRFTPNKYLRKGSAGGR